MHPLLSSTTALPVPATLPVLLGNDERLPSQAGPSLLRATTDAGAVLLWLATHKETPTTYASYRKEAERFLLWLYVNHPGCQLGDMRYEDVQAYIAFLSDPQPAALWVAGGGRRYRRGDPDWRPFAGPLSAASQAQARVILNAMFSWLVAAGHLRGNPMALVRQKKRQHAQKTERFLSDRQWQAVKAYITSLPLGSDMQRRSALRARWVFSLLYVLGLRSSEICATRMDAFLVQRGADGMERWWLRVIGKGDKARRVPVPAPLLVELMRYRAGLGLSALPGPGSSEPLVMPVINRGSGQDQTAMTRAALYQLVKDVLLGTADWMRDQGEDWALDAARLAQASTHWLRHTAATRMGHGKVVHARDNLGHASIATTNAYMHSEDDERHDAMSSSVALGWES